MKPINKGCSHSRSQIVTIVRGVVAGWLPWRILPLLLLCHGVSKAVVPAPGGDPDIWLNSWQFTDTTNWTSSLGYAPISFTNLAASPLGNGDALVVNSTNVAWLQYKFTESDGTNNLTLDRGSVVFWFAPYWASTNQGGTGPGQWGRLLEVGSYTTNASYGWWSLYVDPAGANVYFSAQTNGSGTNYFSVPVAWTTNHWHLFALTYSATNSALYLDGTLATNGPGVTIWPSPAVQANGFLIGSDSGTGLAQAHGMFDDLSTYNAPLDAASISAYFNSYSIVYNMNPGNFGNLSSGSSTPSYGPQFNAVTGYGSLQPLTNQVACVTNGNLCITNVVCGWGTNQTMTVTFAIVGGTAGFAYDVFANSLLVPAASTNGWKWMGQGTNCGTYRLPNLPTNAVFLVLGTPQDLDGDGLTDAYERLVSKTDPNNPDSDGDGMLDGWEVMWGLNPLSNDAGQSTKRSNYTYDPVGWLNLISGNRSETIGLDSEGNVQQDAP